MFVEPAPDPWRRVLEQRWCELRDEACALPETMWAEWAPPVDRYAYGASFVPFAMRYRPPWFTADLAPNLAACPVTASLLEDLPGVYTLAFSRMEPGARVHAHRDLDEPGFLRFHLGLQTDDGARFRCGDRWVTWHEGRVHAFHAATEHEVVHDGVRPRVLLLLDVDAATLAQHRCAGSGGGDDRS